MPNIISQIIEIDTIAQKKLADAAEERALREKEAQEQMAADDAVLWEEARQKIERTRSAEEAEAKEKMERLLKQRDEKIVRLEKVYWESHEKLEQEIYNKVLGL